VHVHVGSRVIWKIQEKYPETAPEHIEMKKCCSDIVCLGENAKMSQRKRDQRFN
jgi:hypothetical protein